MIPLSDKDTGVLNFYPFMHNLLLQSDCGIEFAMWIVSYGALV